MSLRVKVELILFVVVGLVVGLGYGIQRLIILPRLNPLEETVAKKDMLRCIEAIDEQVSLLDTLCSDWCTRADVSRFAQDGDAGGAEPPLNVSYLAEKALNLAYIIDPEGKVVWGRSIDLSTQEPIAVKEFPATRWPLSHPILDQGSDGSSPSGLFMTSLGPVLISSGAILPFGASESGPRTLVIGRFLDQSLIAGIHAQTAVAFQVWHTGDPALSAEARSLLQTSSRNSNIRLEHVAEAHFRVYGTYPDLRGNPALLLQTDIHRNIYARGSRAMQEGLLSQVGIGLVALVVLVILFRRVVINPLTQLTAHATHLGQANDLSARLRLERNDEIGTLATEFDGMVERLEGEMDHIRRAEEALRVSEERYALAVRGANDGLWDWDLETNTIHFSDRWKTMLGYEESEIGSDPEEWFSLIHPEDHDHVLAAIDAHVKGRTAHFESEHRTKHKNASYLWVMCRGMAVYDDNGKSTRMAGSQTDITARKLIEEQLTHQALHDSLTTLPNRALFLDRLTQALRHAERNEQFQFAVLYLDLDRFKLINDGLGHMVGDRLLTMIGEKLKSALRASDTIARSGGTVARFGGDEFVLLLDSIKDVRDAAFVAERIQTLLKEPFHIDEHEIYTTASIGIALSRTGYDSAEEFLRSADTAMYRAKARGEACYEVYDKDMHSKAVARLALETDLRRAVEAEQFMVHYQPIIDLESGKIEAFEALVRWNHPERGVVSPLDFIPVAEETGMIQPIGKFVLRTACRQTRAWQIKLPHAQLLSASVNLSVKEFSNPKLIESIEETLSETGLNPASLKLEITESAIMDNVEFVIRTLKELRERSIQLSIDDFGTGYSSLSYLHRFPMSTLKIDRAFVCDMHTTRESLQIVKTIILLAHALEMKVVAEGIENEDQLRTLRELNCQFGQGYYFSPPVDSAAAEELLAADPVW